MSEASGVKFRAGSPQADEASSLAKRLYRRFLRNTTKKIRKWQWRKLVLANKAVAGRHKGERCFILCNGPSVRKQDLTVLAGETVISVSNGYQHPEYATFKPRYHCVPQITYGLLTETNVINWFHEMHDRIGDAELFLSATEAPLVKAHGLFPGRAVRYLNLNRPYARSDDRTLMDISRRVHGVTSVPIMCLMIAMYMGFRDIYLIGTDHDFFKTREYKYFFEPTILAGKDSSVDANGRVLTGRYEEFHLLATLWEQYRQMRLIGEAHGIRIWNATAGGELDEFPRVRLEDVTGSPSTARNSG